MDRPFQLLPIFRERVWGRESLTPYFPETLRKQRIGEIWFTHEENETASGGTLGQLLASHPEILGTAADPAHPGICPLLIKLLFTSERLSVQVHPDDAYAQRHHGSLGKTEAWYVLDAKPPAEVAIGFKEPLTPERLRASAVSGEIEDLLDWRKAAPGDLFFVPAGTVHAIGAGMTICEVQENSDITYRLYDYGRPRELHLEHGTQVSELGPHTHYAQPRTLGGGRDELLACGYFRMERLGIEESRAVAGGLPYYLLLICLKGAGVIDGQAFSPGEAWMVPTGAAGFTIDGQTSEWMVTYSAPEAAAY
ncbi:MAG TPA: type I phosphomannose isomerase catalytic subunit [Bryobacteraceae bacterium]|nr:type I phosphomannose isomerase catalytic subunit [Bryobacteraceae bacterium]